MTSPTQPIRGKVARILDLREVVINRGSADQVRIGMIFKILSSKDSVITDPDTGEQLGTVGREKTRVKVTEVQPNLAVASTYRSQRVNVGGSGLGSLDTSSLFAPPKWETRVETLKVDDVAIGKLEGEDAVVRIGDLVVQDLSSDSD